MKTYLVGGAVRDQLMGKEISDLDWVVVGATHDEMIAQGYERVGADFPVYLHPETKDEYALARTERKSGKGYLGFEVKFGTDVTIVALKISPSLRKLFFWLKGLWPLVNWKVCHANAFGLKWKRRSNKRSALTDSSQCWIFSVLWMVSPSSRTCSALHGAHVNPS